MKVFFCCLLASSLSLWAETSEPAPTPPQEKTLIPHQSDIRNQARQKAKEELDSEITSTITAQKAKIAWPPPAELTMAEVNNLVDKRSITKLNQQMPPKTTSDFTKEITHKYRPYTKGEQVNITLTRSLGRNPNIRGKFYGIDSYGQLKIGAHKIPTVDVSHIDKLRFFPEIAAPLINKEASALAKSYLSQRDTLLQDLKIAVRKEVNIESGLMYYNRRWVSTRKLVESLRQNLIKKATPDRAKIHAVRLFTEQGFVQKGNNWMHPSFNFIPPEFDTEGQAVTQSSLEDLMNQKGITINASTLSIHPGAKYYDFDF